MSEEKNTLNLSWQSVFRLYFPIFIIILIWYFKYLLLVLVLAFILASLFDKPIDYLALKLKNRFLATLIVYLLILFVFASIVYLSTFILINNFDKFENLFSFKDYSLENLKNFLLNYKGLDLDTFSFSRFYSFNNYLNQFRELIVKGFKIVSSLIGGTFTAFVVILLSFFINTEKNGIEKGIRFLVPWQYEDYAVYLWGKARKKVSNWFFSQLILSAFVGFSVYFVLSILNIKEAELLGFISGVLDFIPYLGPFIAFIIIALFSFSDNLLMGIVALLSFVLIQTIEGLISPTLRSKAMKMNPILIILSLLIGAKIGGVIGVIIILPLMATFVEFIKDWRSGRLESYLPQRRLI